MKSLIFAAVLASGGLAYHDYTHPDAYDIYPPGEVISGAEPVLDLAGKTEVSCSITNKTGVIVVIGQSLSVNEVPTPYTPINSGVDQLNIYNGKCYVASDPLLGINVSGGPVTAQRGTWMSRMADNLVSNGKFDRVILVPMAVGGTTVGQWASNSTPPFLRNNINVVARRMAQAKLPCTAIMWGQGESDTSAATSQTSYTESLNIVIAEFKRAMPGCPILVAQESYYYGSFSAAVVAAQASVVDGSTVFAGENVDLIQPTGRYDNTHLNELGAAQRAELAEEALTAALGL